MVEENNVVMAEGTVRAAWKGGGVLEASSAMRSRWREARSSA